MHFCVTDCIRLTPFNHFAASLIPQITAFVARLLRLKIRMRSLVCHEKQPTLCGAVLIYLKSSFLLRCAIVKGNAKSGIDNIQQNLLSFRVHVPCLNKKKCSGTKRESLFERNAILMPYFPWIFYIRFEHIANHSFSLFFFFLSRLDFKFFHGLFKEHFIRSNKIEYPRETKSKCHFEQFWLS